MCTLLVANLVPWKLMVPSLQNSMVYHSISMYIILGNFGILLTHVHTRYFGMWAASGWLSVSCQGIIQYHSFLAACNHNNWKLDDG